MGLNIKIDLDDCYAIKSSTNDLLIHRFDTVLKGGNTAPIGIRISEETHPLMPNVHNLAFGPFNENTGIDDQAKLNHQDHSKLFSTILLCGMTYLQSNTKKFIGIDGSTNSRAYMYFRCIQKNYDYLNKYVNIYGIDYYVRILRKNREQDSGYPIDGKNVIVRPYPIQKEEAPRFENLSNYFIFNLK